MRSALIFTCVAACVAALLGLSAGRQIYSADAPNTLPKYESGKLVRPEGYREWVFLSSGLGMNYNPSAASADQFTNSFVPQAAYQAFVASGKWPDKTIFVLEERASESKGSINKSGHFQSD